jgi:phospholipase/carboxylesterase
MNTGACPVISVGLPLSSAASTAAPSGEPSATARKNLAINWNQEMVGLGAANLALASFKVFRSASRTPVAEAAGAQTQLTGVVGALAVALILLLAIGKVWQPLLPDAAFVSPHAPEPCGQAPVGRQWFTLTFRDPNERWIGVQQARPVLERFIDAELRRVGLPASALALVGFSQGTMVALHVGLRSAVPPAAIVGFSGLLVVPPDGDLQKFATEISARPPVLLIHGQEDDLIPAQALFQAAQGLAALGLPVQWHLSAGVGHGIDEEGLRHGILAHNFGRS